MPDSRYPRDDGTCLTPREALRTLGDEWGRSRYIDTWVRLTCRSIHEVMSLRSFYTETDGVIRGSALCNESEYLLITDVRRANEAQMVQGYPTNGKLIRVVREGVSADSTHGSDTEVDSLKADIEVVNPWDGRWPERAKYCENEFSRRLEEALVQLFG